MNDRVLAIKEFLKLNYNELDINYMNRLHVRIFDFGMRYIRAEAIDIYIDIKCFIKDGVRRIKDGKNTWYKKDFIEAGLLDNKNIENW